VLTGSIAKLGSQYVLGLKALDCHSGADLAQEQVQAPRKEDVLNALDRAAENVRGTLGESLSTVNKYDAPLEQTTTSSLEALQAFSLGLKSFREKGDAAALVFPNRVSAQFLLVPPLRSRPAARQLPKTLGNFRPRSLRSDEHRSRNRMVVKPGGGVNQRNASPFRGSVCGAIGNSPPTGSRASFSRSPEEGVAG
jgi:hypothetical protein